MALFTIYPIIFTVWVAFTNYGEGHLITKQQAVDQILNVTYLPETGKSYTWTAFKSPDGEYALWLMDAEGNGYLALPGEPLSQPQPGEGEFGALDDNGIPETLEGYERLNAFQAATDKNLTSIQFGEEGKTIQIRSPREAGELLPLYLYDADQDAMINQQSGIVYKNLRGTFTSSEWQAASTGFCRERSSGEFQGIFHQPRPARSPGPNYCLELWLRLLQFAVEFFVGAGNCGPVQRSKIPSQES